MVGVAVAILAAAILVITAPSRTAADRGAAAGGGGGTTVSTDGGTTTITVHMDVCCGVADSQNMTGIISDRINEESRAAEAIWNQAFAKFPAQGCGTLHLAIDARLLQPGDDHHENFHQIQIDYKNPGRPGINNPLGDTTPPTADWTNPYTSGLTGDYFLPNMDERSFAHETGHLLGLGDDYTNVRQEIDSTGVFEIGSAPLGGREGTLMDSGDNIDQALVDRIAAQATKAGNILPTCQHWTGTVHATRDYADSQSTCHIAAEGTATLTVENGKVSGAFDTTGKATCTTKFGTVTLPDAGSWRLSGEQTAGGFVISDLLQVRGSYFDEVVPNIPFTIPLAGPGRISTALMPQLPDATLRIELNCKDCEK